MSHFNKFVCLLLFLFMAADVTFGQSYYKATLKPGDGVLSLLRRYDLERHACNIPEFYRINGLTPGQPLLLNKAYSLPVKIYNYNGKSIRSTLNVSDLNKAISVEDYNKWLRAQGLKPVYFIVDKKLWVPHHIYNCSLPTSTTPAIIQPVPSSESDPTEPVQEKPPVVAEHIENLGKPNVYPLFGSENSNIIMMDNSLKDKVFYIKAGHGGPDPGAMADIDGNICCEDEYANDVALRLGRKIMQHGGTVHFIVFDPNDGIRDDKYLKCDKDEMHAGNRPIPLNQIKRLRTRVEIINNFYREYAKKGIKDQRFISIHIDSRSTSLQLDVHFYHAHGSVKGRQMAVNTQEEFARNYARQGNRVYTGTVKARDLYVIKYSAPPALFVELGNIQNKNDQKRFTSASNRQLLAEWLFKGFTK